METNGVAVQMLRPVDYELPPGVYPDMREHGFDRDDWPEICWKVMAANILVLGTPIWLGEESSVCRRVIERLYGESGKLNDRGQYIYYGRVGGCIVTFRGRQPRFTRNASQVNSVIPALLPTTRPSPMPRANRSVDKADNV